MKEKWRIILFTLERKNLKNKFFVKEIKSDYKLENKVELGE